MYDHNADQKDNNKWSGGNKLEKISNLELPEYINLNTNKYKNWLD
jgi:hypothetical protein